MLQICMPERHARLGLCKLKATLMEYYQLSTYTATSLFEYCILLMCFSIYSCGLRLEFFFFPNYPPSPLFIISFEILANNFDRYGHLQKLLLYFALDSATRCLSDQITVKTRSSLRFLSLCLKENVVFMCVCSIDCF